MSNVDNRKNSVSRNNDALVTRPNEQENVIINEIKGESRKRLNPNDDVLDQTPPANRVSPEMDPVTTPITNARQRAKVPQLYLTAGSTPPPTHLFKNKVWHSIREKADTHNREVLSQANELKRQKIDENDMDSEEENPNIPNIVKLPSVLRRHIDEAPLIMPKPEAPQSDILDFIQKPVVEILSSCTPPIFTPERPIKEIEDGAGDCGLLVPTDTGETSLIGKILSRPSMGCDVSDEEHGGDVVVPKGKVQHEEHLTVGKEIMKNLNKIDPMFISSKPCDPKTSGRSGSIEGNNNIVREINEYSNKCNNDGIEDIYDKGIDKKDINGDVTDDNMECYINIDDLPNDDAKNRSSPQLLEKVQVIGDTTADGYVLDHPLNRPAVVDDTAKPAERMKRKTLPSHSTDSGKMVPSHSTDSGSQQCEENEVTVDIEEVNDTNECVNDNQTQTRGRPSVNKVKAQSSRGRRSISEPRGRSGGPGGLAGSAVYKAHNTAFFIINPSVLEDTDVWDIVHLRRLCHMLGIDDENCSTHKQYVALLSLWNRNPSVLLHSPDICTNYHAGVVNTAVCNFNHMPIMRSKLPKRYRSIVDPLPKERQLQSSVKNKSVKRTNRIKFSPYNHMVSFDLSAEERYDKKLCLYEIASLQSLENNEAGIDPEIILLDPTRELAGDPSWELAKKNMMDNMRRTSSKQYKYI